MQAKKSYGQHFLHQKAILKKIAGLLLNFDFPNVLEIGPGKGALTQFLLEGKHHFLAVEADPDMQDYLITKKILKENQLLRADVLKVDFGSLFNGQAFLVCGNFPYNISSQILIKTLLHADKIPVLIGMFQKEVVTRIISPPGNRDYGTLSVLTQLMYEGKNCFDIHPSAFIPPPKVTSSVLQLTRKSDFLSQSQFQSLQKLVRTAFQFRRKTLRNNLKSCVADQALLSDVYFNQRPEAISPAEFLELGKKLGMIAQEN